MAPKTFVSHSGADQKRFVTRFAERLRAKGVDAWFSGWEMLPGDKLIDKIFDEGLKNAAAVIVVLSRNSIESPWVKEELDAALVKRINDGSKLIPVVLDNCEVPLALKSTLWHSVKDEAAIEEAADAVAAAIFDHRVRPPLGPAPIFSSPAYQPLPGMTPTETFLLMQSCKWTIEHGSSGRFINPESLLQSPDASQLTEKAISEATETLSELGYVRVVGHLGRGLQDYSVTIVGMELFLANAYEGYDEIVNRVIGLVANEGVKRSDEIATRLSVQHIIVRHILAKLELEKHLRLSRTMGSVSQVFHVSASLRRLLS